MRQFEPIHFTPPSGDSKRPRTLYKGGGGGDGGAAKRAEAEEKAKASARAAVNRIFGIGDDADMPVKPTLEQFVVAPQQQVDQLGRPVGGQAAYQYNKGVANPQPTYNTAAYQAALKNFNTRMNNYRTTAQRKASREAQYDDAGNAVYDFNMKTVNEDAERAGRLLRFELARRGLTAGSEDINQQQRFGERFDFGRLQARNAGDSVKAQLRAEDERTRLNLINSINAGTDASSAIAGATASLKNNLDTIKSDAMGQTIGNVFEDGSLIYSAARTAAEAQQNPYQRRSSLRPVSTSASYSGSSRSY